MIVLIAYGNELRRDDGAGLRLAERMAERWLALGASLHHLAVQQLTPELAMEIAEPGVAAVVFVDTRAAAGLSDAVEIMPLTPPETATPSLGHHVQPDVLLAYAALLLEGRPAPPAWLVTVPGVAFDHGEGLSETVSAAMKAAFASDDRPLPQLIRNLAVRMSPRARSSSEHALSRSCERKE
jgi:hydrogenase maturation protease